MEGTQQLHQAIAALYEVFARYPLRPHIDACPCCVGDTDHRRLYRADLHDLQPDDLSKYAIKAMTTWGDIDDFRHFLPRLFELAVDASALGLNNETLFFKLQYGKWCTWPDGEQQALVAYFDALWRWILMTPEQPDIAEEYLCSIAQAVDDVRPFLEAWQQLVVEASVVKLAAFLDATLPQLVRKGTIGNGFWERRPEQMRQVIVWLRNPQTCAFYEQSFYRLPDAPFSGVVAEIVDQLEYLALTGKSQ